MILLRILWLALSLTGMIVSGRTGTPTAMSVHSQITEQDQPVVRAVMFWMDTCGHCHYVLENVLPPLQEKYGEKFELALIEVVTDADVDRLRRTAAEYGIHEDQVFVPFLIIGDTVLIGSDQVETYLPDLIEDNLMRGGLDYPQATSLADLFSPSQPKESGSLGIARTAFATVGEQIGFVLANLVLLGMVGALVYTLIILVRGRDRKAEIKRVKPSWRNLAIPVLAFIGLCISGYLAYVETQAIAAVCGPLGDCNAVQTSPYARLFGLLPVGVLGLIGYAGILGVWTVGRFGRKHLSNYAAALLLGIALAGTLFSIYLTYLEPYVIEAVCVWCLTSAVVITVLLILSIRPGREALSEITKSGSIR